jgi:hypothetical protein
MRAGSSHLTSSIGPGLGRCLEVPLGQFRGRAKSSCVGPNLYLEAHSTVRRQRRGDAEEAGRIGTNEVRQLWVALRKLGAPEGFLSFMVRAL